MRPWFCSRQRQGKEGGGGDLAVGDVSLNLNLMLSLGLFCYLPSPPSLLEVVQSERVYYCTSH